MVQTDKETFRHVIGHFASGVTVLTTRHGDEDFGATASAVSSLSLEPPMLLVCLHMRSNTQEAIHASGRLGVNILDEDQGMVAERFASPRGTDIRERVQPHLGDQQGGAGNGPGHHDRLAGDPGEDQAHHTGADGDRPHP